MPLTEEQTEEHVQVAKDYWQAVINSDWKRVSKIRPSLSAEKWVAKHAENPPVELIKIGRPYWQEGCSSCPVTPCIVKFADGKIREVKLLTTFRGLDGKLVGHIPATWGKAREMESNELRHLPQEQEPHK